MRVSVCVSDVCVCVCVCMNCLRHERQEVGYYG